MYKWIVSVFSLLLAGCGGYPQNVTPVQQFDISRYLGTWYEVARLDHSFERGLDQVSAEYTRLDEGKIRVVNRGYDADKDRWKEAVGKAFLAGENGEAYLKVSFFAPFYSSYVIFGLDQKQYNYAFVSGPNHNYLWLLSRTPQVEEHVMTLFLKTAEALGFKTEELIYVKQ